MSNERMVIGVVLCFLSGVVLSLPPEFWQEVFSLPRLVANWLDAGVLACAGVWIGLVLGERRVKESKKKDGTELKAFQDQVKAEFLAISQAFKQIQAQIQAMQKGQP